MEFIHYLLGGMLDLIVLIIMLPILPFLRIIDSKKLNTFLEDIFTKIFSEKGLF